MKTVPSTNFSAAHSSPRTSDDLTPPMQYFLRTVYTPDDIIIGMETALMKAELDELPEKAKQFAVDEFLGNVLEEGHKLDKNDNKWGVRICKVEEVIKEMLSTSIS
uniref:Uncharacterized protein n=1 Tax=Euplotes harpa TaxID=151035 RepID=A0A7S3JML2_9SPIT|mmetsp:Transcript_9907/g.11128  ORF Transcript_9907/g.11128 Transcript_9907/m.11128 type:complete len:106 (+) Transcript_9907:539-856(+)|eukprot:CAMPEP_0168325290 /NCGR_PEP_ID=MMETSP0213-20121227/4607_1 /TAXON_ID=151035 /ORGANISM="Euplotes harpa, Strain FSP1.4" /LENGTH=105 /DNA_ID=CAMNT_0008327761 /DNA_START=549 /DNA_END=866 /DNA_ORIENTATION=+